MRIDDDLSAMLDEVCPQKAPVVPTIDQPADDPITVSAIDVLRVCRMAMDNRPRCLKCCEARTKTRRTLRPFGAWHFCDAHAPDDAVDEPDAEDIRAAQRLQRAAAKAHDGAY